MKDKIDKIFTELKQGKLSLELAQQQVLDLFVVSGTLQFECKYCGTIKKTESGLCDKCHRF